MPALVRSLVSEFGEPAVARPEQACIVIGQGLRTGCNGFFYVDLISRSGDQARIRLSEMFASREIDVPNDVLVRVLRRQAEYRDSATLALADLRGCVLDLNHWVLPEDFALAQRSLHLYGRFGEPVPRVMGEPLAAYVSQAARTVYGSGLSATVIPGLTAVRTNVRVGNDRPPRFWYMLPAFAKRHRPYAFVPRINQLTPVVTRNGEPPALIDANFSTLWFESAAPADALPAVLNSSWCRASMEALGTPMGGGALKLEATQLNQLPMPVLSSADLEWLAFAFTSRADQGHIDRFVLSRVFPFATPAQIAIAHDRLTALAERLCATRQRRLA